MSPLGKRRPADPIVLELAEGRRRLGLSQRAVGRHLGMDHKTVSRWESGRGTPKLADARAYAEMVGVRLTLVVDGPEDGGCE